MTANGPTMALAGPLAGNGLQSLLLAAAARNMYASIIIDGAAASGVIHLVDGQIALVGSDDLRTMRVAQHELTNLLRQSIGSSVGTYRRAPLSNIPNAHELRSVGVQQVLTAVGAISSSDSVGADTQATPAPQAAPVAVPVTSAAPVADSPSTTAAPAPVAAASSLNPNAQERPVRASQLRKMLRVKRAAQPVADAPQSADKLLNEPDGAVDRQAALRSIIRDLAQ